MAISSINFAKSSGGSFAHNDRTEKEPDYLLLEERRLDNECNRSAIEAQAILENLFEIAKENYYKTYGQKFQTKFENVHWEAVINLNEEHTIKDVEKLVMEIEKETGFTAIQISIHRDEGHVNEKTDYTIHNLHAHVNFFTLNPETGQQLYRRTISNSEREKIRKENGIPEGEKIPKHLTGVMDKEKLSKLQDITADTLGMQRGVRGSEKVRLGHKQYRATQQEKEKLLEKIEELQKENTQLHYSFRETQKLITALEITPEEKKELHRFNTEVNKIKSDGEAQDLKIIELEEKIKTLEIPHPVNKIPKNLAEMYGELKGIERFEVHKQMRKIVGESDGLEVGDLKFKLERSEKANETLRSELQEQKEAQSKESIELNKKVVLGAEIEALETKLSEIKIEIGERIKPPEEIIEEIYWRNDDAMVKIFQETAENLNVKDGLVGSKKVSAVTVEKFNKILPQIREISRNTLNQLAENIPKTVDTKQVEALEKQLSEERKKNFELTFELKQIKEKTQEVWENIKERFKFEGSRLQSTMGNLLDFSKKDPKELDNQKSQGLER